MIRFLERLNPHLLHVLPLALMLAVYPRAPFAQGLDAEGAIDTIIGSDVKTGEEAAASEPERIIAAIENTAANTSEVRKKFSLDSVEILFLPDIGEGHSGVSAKLAEMSDRVDELREAIEGSAMFYHAVDSRGILLRDIVALEFNDDNGVTIFVSGSQQ